MSNLRSDCREIAEREGPGLIQSHMNALCNQIDLVEEYWHAAERHRQVAEASLLRLSSFEKGDISEDDVDAIEGLIGMGAGAWDMEDPRDIVVACCKHMVSKAQPPSDTRDGGSQ